MKSGINQQRNHKVKKRNRKANKLARKQRKGFSMTFQQIQKEVQEKINAGDRDTIKRIEAIRKAHVNRKK